MCFNTSELVLPIQNEDISEDIQKRTIGLLLQQRSLRLKIRYKKGTERDKMAPKRHSRSTVERESAAFVQGKLKD